MKPGLKAWLKFNAVGLIGVGVQLAALAFFRSLLGWGIRVATLTAVECAVLHNFVWHERWTWAHRELSARGIVGRLLKFNVSNGLISMLGNLDHDVRRCTETVQADGARIPRHAERAVADQPRAEQWRRPGNDLPNHAAGIRWWLFDAEFITNLIGSFAHFTLRTVALLLRMTRLGSSVI